jgi:hypothetical protein
VEENLNYQNVKNYLNDSLDKGLEKWRTKMAKEIIKNKDVEAIKYLLHKAEICAE